MRKSSIEVRELSKLTKLIRKLLSKLSGGHWIRRWNWRNLSANAENTVSLARKKMMIERDRIRHMKLHQVARERKANSLSCNIKSHHCESMIIGDYVSVIHNKVNKPLVTVNMYCACNKYITEKNTSSFPEVSKYCGQEWLS